MWRGHGWALSFGVSVMVAGKRETWVPPTDEEMFTYQDIAARVVVACSVTVAMVTLFVVGVCLGVSL